MAGIVRIGHRGACGYAPENTIASFRKALELQVDMIELDVYRCKSGELVVIHDPRLERTTNGAGYVGEKTLSELQALDAGNGEKIPTLREALDAIGRRARVNVELKGAETARPLAAVIEEYVGGRGWSYDDFLVSSFDHYQLHRFSRIAGGVRTGALVLGIPLGYARAAEKLGASSIHLNKDFVNREFVKDAHGRGMKVFVYTVDEPEDVARLRTLGVDGMFSNYPDRL